LTNSDDEFNFLQKNGLEYISNWLKKTKTGVYPSDQFCLKLIEIVSNMKVEYRHMEKNKLGSILRKIQKRSSIFYLNFKHSFS